MMNGDVLKICLISVRQGLCESNGENEGMYTYLQMKPNLGVGPFDWFYTRHYRKGAQGMQGEGYTHIFMTFLFFGHL